MPWFVTLITQVVVSDLLASNSLEALKAGTELVTGRLEGMAVMPWLAFYFREDQGSKIKPGGNGGGE